MHPHIPGQRTRPSYYIDDAVKEAGFTVTTSLNPTAVKVIHEPAVGLLTGNGPQAIDAQARKLRTIITARTAGAGFSGSSFPGVGFADADAGGFQGPSDGGRQR